MQVSLSNNPPAFLARHLHIPGLLFCLLLVQPLWADAPAAGQEQEETRPSAGATILSEVAAELRTAEELVAAVQLAGEESVTVITLDEVVALALAENPSLIVAAFDPEIAEAQLRAARAEFDPTFRAGGEYAASDVDVSRSRSLLEWIGLAEGNPAVDAATDTTAYDAGIAGKLPTGLRYQAGVARSDESRDIDAFGADADVRGDSASLAVTQPILRGGGIRLNRAEITRSAISREAADAAYYLERQETVAESIAAYWQLVGAYATLSVRRAAVRTAEQLLDDTRERNALGAVSDVEVLTAQAGLARRQNELIVAVADIGSASDRLKALLDLREGTGLTAALLAPDHASAPPDLAALPLGADVRARTEAALARRPEMFLGDAERRIAAVTLMQRRNARLPQLDAFGEIGMRDLDEDYDGFVLGDRREDGDYWSAGFRASIPLGNRRARAEERAARLRAEQAGENYHALETAIMEDVRQALRSLRASAVTVENARKTVALERARFRGEQERFLFGSTTAFQVLLVQDDLIAEETRLAVAEAGLMAELANLQRAEGTLLEELGHPLPAALIAPKQALPDFCHSGPPD